MLVGFCNYILVVIEHFLIRDVTPCVFTALGYLNTGSNTMTENIL